MGKVVVIGGGPSGCIAARSAVVNGCRATVYEEHWRIGSPVQCSGLVSKKGLDSIGVDYSGSVLNEICGANITGPGVSMRIRARETKAFVIDRPVFDAICAQEAEREGARLVLGTRGVLPSGNGVVIGADGVFSPTARTAGFPGFHHLVSCYQAEFTGARPDEKNIVGVYLSKKLFPGFFGWVIPVNEERVRVGVGVSFGRNPKASFDAFVGTLANTTLEGARQQSWLGGCIPLSPRKRSVLGRVMLVGDAAGQVKALSGGGVYFGCSCASIAGKVAALHPKETWRYEKEWRDRFYRDLRLHRLIRAGLDALPEPAMGPLMSACKVLGMEQFLVSYGDMDRPTEIAKAVGSRSVSFVSKRFNTLLAIFTSIV